MISLSNTGTYPRAVMVMHLNAGITTRTMKSPRWPRYLAGFAKAQHHLMSVDVSNYILETLISLTHLFEDRLIPLLFRACLLG
jgi:hypothetical protein